MRPRSIILPFPLAGINKNFAKSAQPEMTSPDMVNVRPADVMHNRIRGGQRPGLRHRYSVADTAVPVIALGEVTVVEVI